MRGLSSRTPMNVTAVGAEKVSEFKMKISHIVTNGCSFTYCQGLSNLVKQGWPALVANQLNCPLVNLGMPAVGNDNIYRRTSEYLYNNLVYPESKPLVIIAWTQPWRREAWTESKKGFRPISFPHNKPQNNHERAVLENWNEESFLRITLMYKLALINLCENLNIPYLTTDYANSTYTQHEAEIEDKLKVRFSQMYEKLQNKYQIEPFYKLSQSLPKLPCGHDGKEAQELLANYTVKKIKELHSDLIFTKDQPYLQFKEMFTNESYYSIYPEWRRFQLD